MSNAIAGDIVYFRGGTYELGASSGYHGVLEPSNSGTSSTNPITFAAYPKEVPVMNCHPDSNQDNCRAFGNGDKNYIIFDGFTFMADGGNKMGGLIITGANIDQRVTGNIVRNCIIDGGSTIITSTDNLGKGKMFSRRINFRLSSVFRHL